MRSCSLLAIGAIFLLAIAFGKHIPVTDEKPDALEQLIGNSYLRHFISTKSNVDINKFSIGSKVCIFLN